MATSVKLNTGAEMPKVGLGTWKVSVKCFVNRAYVSFWQRERREIVTATKSHRLPFSNPPYSNHFSRCVNVMFTLKMRLLYLCKHV